MVASTMDGQAKITRMPLSMSQPPNQPVRP